MAKQQVDMVPVEEATTTSLIIPLSSSGADGKAKQFDVRDEQGDAMLVVDASSSNVAITATTLVLTGSAQLNSAAVATAATVAADRPRIDVITETVLYTDFTDGGLLEGTYAFTGDTIPVGALVLGTKVLVAEGFAGDTTAAMTIGDGVDADRYNTGTLDVFATAATGIASTAPSGDLLHTAAATPVLTVTSTADFTSISAGSVTVSIYYISTV